MVAAVVFYDDSRVSPARASLPPPPIPLSYRSSGRSKRGSAGIKLKLQSEPNNPANASQYGFFMKFLTPLDTDPETYCNWVIDLKKVITGQNIAGGPARYRLARDLLQGRHLFDFNAYAQELGAETIPHFEECIRRLGLQIFPKQSKTRQIFAMRNAVKPERVSIRDFFGRFKDIEAKMQEVEPLGLNEDDWKDILVRAMPEDYISRMFEGGFDPENHTLLETLNRLERYETADLVGNGRSRVRASPKRRPAPRPTSRKERFGRDKRRTFKRNRHFNNRSFNNRSFNNRSSNYQQNRNRFASRRQFNPSSNQRPAFNGNRQANANGNNFQRNVRFNRNGNGNNRNNGGGNRRWNRREQEANQIDIIDQDASNSSDISL